MNEKTTADDLARRRFDERLSAFRSYAAAKRPETTEALLVCASLGRATPHRYVRTDVCVSDLVGREPQSTDVLARFVFRCDVTGEERPWGCEVGSPPGRRGLQ